MASEVEDVSGGKVGESQACAGVSLEVSKSLVEAVSGVVGPDQGCWALSRGIRG